MDEVGAGIEADAAAAQCHGGIPHLAGGDAVEADIDGTPGQVQALLGNTPGGPAKHGIGSR